MTDKLLKSLLYAEFENKVDDIIKNISFLSNPKSWVPYTILTRDGRDILISSDSQKEETTKSRESIDFYFTCDINNNVKRLNEVYLDKFRRRAAAFVLSVVLTLRENIPNCFESTDNDNE